MREIAKKLKISNNAVYYSLHRTEQTVSNQNRKMSGRPRCTTVQEDKYIRVSNLRNRCLTRTQLAASLNSTHKTHFMGMLQEHSCVQFSFFIIIQSIRKVFRLLPFIHILLRYSLILKWIKLNVFLINLQQLGDLVRIERPAENDLQRKMGEMLCYLIQVYQSQRQQ
jgi:hypothetical protein